MLRRILAVLAMTALVIGGAVVVAPAALAAPSGLYLQQDGNTEPPPPGGGGNDQPPPPGGQPSRWTPERAGAFVIAAFNRARSSTSNPETIRFLDRVQARVCARSAIRC